MDNSNDSQSEFTVAIQFSIVREDYMEREALEARACLSVLSSLQIGSQISFRNEVAVKFLVGMAARRFPILSRGN